MLNKVLAAIKDYDMFSYSREVTVALSGGADSVALLYSLIELREQLNINITAAHLNHMLRGEEAFRDQNFVKGLCAELGIPLKTESIDVAAVAKKSKESTELAARKVRYEFLERVATGVIATAHTASDSFETTLFNLTRGSSIVGLCGIPPKRDVFIRPLIYCTRQEIEKYCAEKNISYVNDSTNFSEDYSRNKIRLSAVPVLKAINPSVERNFVRNSRFLSEDASFLNETADKLYEKVLEGERLNADKLKKEHKAIVKRVLVKYFKKFGGGEIDSINIEDMYSVLMGEKTAVMLNKDCTLKQKNGFLEIVCQEAKDTFSYKTNINIVKKQNVNNLFLNNTFDYDKITGELVIRARLSGDKIRLMPGGVSKTLKKLFNELKIPNEKRDLLPVIADDHGVVWIYGVGIDKRVVPDSKTKTFAQVECTEIIN